MGTNLNITISGIQESNNYKGPINSIKYYSTKESCSKTCNKKCTIFGNSTMKGTSGGNVDGQQQSGANGSSSSRTYFTGIFPRMKYY